VVPAFCFFSRAAGAFRRFFLRLSYARRVRHALPPLVTRELPCKPLPAFFFGISPLRRFPPPPGTEDLASGLNDPVLLSTVRSFLRHLILPCTGDHPPVFFRCLLWKLLFISPKDRSVIRGGKCLSPNLGSRFGALLLGFPRAILDLHFFLG